MMEIGSTVEAPVVRVEAYGIYLKYDDEMILVLAPEFSWESGDIRKKVKVGDTMKVQILRLNYQTGENVGSIRRLQQQQNPYGFWPDFPAGQFCGVGFPRFIRTALRYDCRTTFGDLL